jgi:glycosyltransferase involved in cell wall biosynthesis
MSTPAATVVVATRDRPHALARCLTALTWQTLSPLEVVVVDDASADGEEVRAVVARTLLDRNGGPQMRVVVADGLGPAAARNLGARAAGAPVVCFTDDDCVPVPRWAELLVAACAGGGAAAGTTVADAVAGRAAIASQLVTHTLQLASLDAAAGTLGFAPTCNLACRADMLRALPFDESFALAAGEDRDWCSRLAAAGVGLRFVPEAIVEHCPQMGMRGLLSQGVRYGRGAVRFRAAGEGRRLSGRAFYARLARESVRAGPTVAVLVVLAQAAVAVGGALELGRGRR